MKSQTERPVKRSDNQRPARTAKTKGYTKQTARIEARRDGKPLIFGWGGHLSHNEKVRIQRRATWTLTGLIAFVLVAVIVGFWINTNIIIPGQPITSVNGHPIPQSQYRKLVAFKAQVQDNQINGVHGIIAQRKDLEKQDLAQSKIITDTQNQINTLNSQIQKLPGGSSQRADLNNQLTAAQKKLDAAQTQHAQLQQQINNINQNTLPQAQQDYTQSQVGNDSATWLQDDELIREWLANQSPALQTRINPTPDAINQALNAFKANFPSNLSYDKFLSQDGVSNDDMQSMIALKLRRDNMQSYLATLITSPAYQVLARQISLPTMSDAQNVLKQLQHGANFGALAKAKSLDTATASNGGSWGWLARGQLATQNAQAIVENWIFDPHRRINEMSPIITENGDYHIVQILGIDPSRPVDDATLKSLKNNAFSDWLLMIRALPTTNISKVDQNMLLDSMNMPPNLPSAAPGPSNGGAPGGLPGGGLPGGAPGGLPGSGQPGSGG